MGTPHQDSLSDYSARLDHIFHSLGYSRHEPPPPPIQFISDRLQKLDEARSTALGEAYSNDPRPIEVQIDAAKTMIDAARRCTAVRELAKEQVEAALREMDDATTEYEKHILHE